MEKYIKTFVYSSIALAVVAFYFSYQLANKLQNIEIDAYYTYFYEEDEENSAQVYFRYLDSLGGRKVSWLWGRAYSYPEMLDWNIRWGLRSDEGLEGEFSWQPNYGEMLLNLSNQKNEPFLIKTLDATPKLQTSAPFFDAWEFIWKENGNPALKDYFPVCAEANDNTEAFSILRKELLAYLPKAQIILEERLKNAEIEGSAFWIEGSWMIEIQTKGWLNRKAFSLLMESKGELNIHDLSYDKNLKTGLLFYDRYLNQENDDFNQPITGLLDYSVVKNLPNGPILKELEIESYSYYEAFNAKLLTIDDSIQQRITHFLEDSLSSQFLPPRSFFAWTESLTEVDYYEEKRYLLGLNNTALVVNGHIHPAIVLKAEKNEFDETYYDVFFQFNTNEKIEAWKNETILNLGRRVAFVLDGEIIFMPQVNEYILDGKVVLFDNFSKATAYSLASLISSPTLYVEGVLEAENWGLSTNFYEIDYQQLCFLALSLGFILGAILVVFQIIFKQIRSKNQP